MCRKSARVRKLLPWDMLGGGKTVVLAAEGSGTVMWIMSRYMPYTEQEGTIIEL